MTLRSGPLAWTLAAASALLVACMPTTDRERYEVGDRGTATFHNRLAATLYLGGCGHFDYEKRVGREWISKGSDIVCLWEGFAEPVAPGEVVVDPIMAREPGTWRLRYPVGIGCSETEPLSQCPRVEDVHSNEFEVVDGGDACVVTGCSGQVCAEDHVATTCEWRPEYACYRDANCGRFGAGGSCGWQATPELARCLLEAGAGLSPAR